MNSSLNLLQISPSASGEAAYLYEVSINSTEALNALRDATKTAFQRTWRNPEFTDAEMIAAMGTSAKANFERHSATIQYLLYMGVSIPAAEYTPPKPYTVHEDGTIILGN